MEGVAAKLACCALDVRTELLVSRIHCFISLLHCENKGSGHLFFSCILHHVALVLVIMFLFPKLLVFMFHPHGIILR